MFEEICLTCGKHLSDDGRVYCSDECQNLDTASPSISSASSAYSSPHLGFAIGGEVPALVPSALGKALRGYHSRDRLSVSSSSASSTSCSILTDDEDEDSHFVTGSDGGYRDSVDLNDWNPKSGLYPVHRAPLSYARRPSGTNNGHAGPHALGRGSTSRSFPGLVDSAPRSAPNHHMSMEDDENYSDFGSSTRDETDASLPLTLADEEQKRLTITKAKRARNRASLPAYFSLLQADDASSPCVSLSVSGSSGHTAARPSPPTPKLTLGRMPHHPYTAPPTATIQVTPRGRRRDLDASRSTRASGSSPSTSRSRYRHPLAPPAQLGSSGSKGSKSSMERIFDWAAVSGPPRGRTAIRRNSSPPPKMVVSPMLTEQFAVTSRGRKADSTSRPRARGRTMVAELDGLGCTEDAPGYGHGRSGLLHRERVLSQRQAGRPVS